jgi:hypothetical protein
MMKKPIPAGSKGKGIRALKAKAPQVAAAMGYKKGGSARPGLWANINRRKKLGISRPKSKSTISAKAYANMKAGFPKKK